MTAIVHAEFTLEHQYPASPARVRMALTDKDARSRWFFSASGFTINAIDPPEAVAPGATEHSRFSRPGTGIELTNDTTWLDVADHRLIFAYAMTVAGQPLSSSLVTITLAPEGGGTLMRFTEQGAYLQGSEKGREEGTIGMLERLGEELARV
jgi:uncharacterized protein YndB with AHSA1/START domain